jgi:hypothetical protein
MRKKTTSHIEAMSMTGTNVESSCEAETGAVDLLVLFAWGC